MINLDLSPIIVRPGTPAVEARVTAPLDPGSSAHQGALTVAYDMLGWGDAWREQRVNHDTAMTYSAVWGCVRVISQSLAGVGWHAYERKPDDPRFRLPIEDDVAWLLALQSNPEMSAFDWRQVMLKDALTRGNGYAEIERTNSGKPAWLWRLEPDRVEPVRDEAGSLWYKVENGPGREPSYLRPENVFHLKGLGPDGLVGWSVIAMARRSIELGLAEERFGTDFFSRGPMPGGVVTIPAKLNETQRKEFRRSFEEVYSGARNAHRVVVLSDGVTFSPADLPNDDAQFLESRTFQVGEICRWYGVPPHKLADLSRATFSNVEEQERGFVTDCLLPWARRLESEADIKLFGPVKRGRRFTRLNLDALMRGNSQTQTDTVTKKVSSGINTVNEGREYFDLNPIPGGDTPLIQGAMIPLVQAINPPDPPEPPVSDPNKPNEPTDPPVKPDPAAVRRVFGAILTDAYSRLLRVDADKARRAANKGKLAEHLAEWYAVPAALERVDTVLRPIYQGLALAMDHEADRGGEWVTSAAMRHIVWCREQLEGAGVSAAEAWDNRPAEVAGAELEIFTGSWRT